MTAAFCAGTCLLSDLSFICPRISKLACLHTGGASGDRGNFGDAGWFQSHEGPPLVCWKAGISSGYMLGGLVCVNNSSDADPANLHNS